MKYMTSKVLQILSVILCVTFLSSAISAQEYRTISGEGNNLENPDWGVRHGPIRRITPVDFSDGVSAPGAVDRANAREVSNAIFDQPQSIPESGKHSDFIWVFGQFIDHDVTMIRSDEQEPLVIQVPACDEHFDPTCTGESIIPMNRSLERPGTGTSSNNPREYQNEITAFIDGSNIYGSDEERMNYLRTFEDGKLRTSHGDLLPLNTLDGEFNSGRDFSAPEMDMMNPTATKWFVAGDVRANENVLLTGIHTLFVREHNYWAEQLKESNPSWSDETLFQEAKLRTTAVLQAIVYEEWLPAMGIQLPEYKGYDPNVNPNIIKAFSTAAFRLGHTMLNSNIKRMMEDCQTHPNGDIDLLTAFFNPVSVLQDGGIDPLLRGMAAQDMQEIDGRIVDDVRNFLFGVSGPGIGMDLAAININRGREMGLPDFNSVRSAFGLPRYNEMSEICRDEATTVRMLELYGSVDNIDAWVGMLCEEHMSDEDMFGRTITEILKMQFMALRDGDRFYYENDIMLSDEEKADIKRTTLGDVIKRNTDLRFMQDNVFLTKADCEHTNFVLENVMLDAVVYPNPAVDLLKLGVNSTIPEAELVVRVSDNLGREVSIQRFDLVDGTNILEVDISNLIPGNYLLQMRSGAATCYEQFVRL